MDYLSAQNYLSDNAYAKAVQLVVQALHPKRIFEGH
jgi:hypothetical protein